VDKSIFDGTVSRVAESLERVTQLNAQYRSGSVHAYVPAALHESERSLEDLVQEHMPASHAALEAASSSLFFSLPVAFDPVQSVGPYLAAVDRDAAGRPYRFLDMGALIATQAFGENEPVVVKATLERLPFLTSRYAHSEYQTVLSLRLKAELNRIAPAGTPRHFVVNTGAEAVENAIKSVLLNRVMTAPDGYGGFVVSFDGAFHGRTLGSLAVTHRKKARLGSRRSTGPTCSFRSRIRRRPRKRPVARQELEAAWISWCRAASRAPRRARTRSGARWTRSTTSSPGPART
jgi:4-aminobutyrate aminotransferase-like enzyme